jgi:hypothetical protein
LKKKNDYFLCHIGLAICHKELGDHPNFKISLLQASEVQIHSAIEGVANSLTSKVKSNKVASIVAIGLILYPPITAGVLYTTSELEKIKSRRSGLESEQKKIKAYLSSIDI